MEGLKKNHHGHHTHAIPPQKLYDIYKEYQNMTDTSIDDDPRIVDFTRGLTLEQKEKIVPVGEVSSEVIEEAQREFLNSNQDVGSDQIETKSAPEACTIYEHKEFDGLRILPALLPIECQSLMLDVLLHRDLAHPLHKTNIHNDYSIPYPPPIPGSKHSSSFFTYPQTSKNQVFSPLDPHSKHKPLNTGQVLQKKLRWLTLGSQYDWSTRTYPSSSPTPFPPDIASLVKRLFSNSFTPESGVVLLYSLKDYMPVHRDVSEECERGLASFTLGCDGLFIIARDINDSNGGIVDEQDDQREQETVVLRVRSGDVVQMGGETRWAWHAMPKVLAGTCPEALKNWPVKEGCPRAYEKWKGFMRGKRLNISCRQVWGE